MEDVGRRHLDELIRRCMVQMTKTDLQGRAKRCQLHDKMRDLSIAKGGEEKNFEVVGRAAPSSDYLATATGFRKLRRCAIILDDERYVFPQHLTPQLRTVFFVGIVRHELSIVDQYFKLVKVLQFQGIIFGSKGLESEFCGVIGDLTNLRYLGLKDNYLYLLPNSIGNLVSLQTLDLRGTNITNLPNVIWRMRQLRDLYLPAANSFSPRMETLTKLHTLCPIKAGVWITDLVKMTNLKKLVIYDLATIQLEKVIDIIVAKLDKLISLSLGMKLHGKFSKLDQLLQKQNLLSLPLEGRIWSNPSSWPLNNTKLILKESRLAEDPMPTLQVLQNLAHLILETAYYGTNMVCSEKGFPQLEYLRMKNIKYLVEWRVEEGAMPCLTTCEIHYCDSLKMVPQGFKFVTTLQKLWITENAVRTDKLEERVKEGGEDWDSIKNIHSIILENH